MILSTSCCKSAYNTKTKYYEAHHDRVDSIEVDF
jgi:hypothetical protein